MDLIELALALFIVGQIVRMLIFAIPKNYPDVLEQLFLAAGGIGYAHFHDSHSYVEGVAAAGLALFLLELYVVTLKSSAITIRHNNR